MIVRAMLATLAFVAVCLMGVAVGSAYGVHWGTEAAGEFAVWSLVGATFAFLGVFAYDRL